MRISPIFSLVDGPRISCTGIQLIRSIAVVELRDKGKLLCDRSRMSALTPCDRSPRSSESPPCSQDVHFGFPGKSPTSSIGKWWKMKKNKKTHIFVPSSASSPDSPSEDNHGHRDRLSVLGALLRHPDHPSNSNNNSLFYYPAHPSGCPRQRSAPELHGAGGEVNMTCGTPMMNGQPFSALQIDTTGHGETAGSGLDYVPQIPSPNRGYTAHHVSFQELSEERLAKIRSMIDEKKRVLGVVREDIQRLELSIRRSNSPSPSREDHTQSEVNVIHEEIDYLKAQLEKIRNIAPDIVPPPVPPHPHFAKWICLECTSTNESSVYRCENCMVPSIRIDPQEAAVCRCELCSSTKLELVTPPQEPDWVMVSSPPPNYYRYP